MRHPLRTVARGLIWVKLGTAALLLLWLCMVASAFDLIYIPYSYRYVVYSALACGLGMAFVGRSLGLAVPPDAHAARAWGMMAVVIDGCGLFSAVTSFVLAQLGIRMGSEVTVGATLFSLGGLLLGRVAFLFYLRAVAKYVGDRPLAVRTLTVFWHAVAVAAVFGLFIWWIQVTFPGRAVVQAWLMLMSLALLHWTWRYVRLLSAMGTAFRAYTPPPLDAADDPDREYREQYERRLADGLTVADRPPSDPTGDV